MITQEIAIFAQGSSFMYTLMAASYFLYKKQSRLKSIMGLILALWCLLHLKELGLLFLGNDHDFKITQLMRLIDMTAIPTFMFLLTEMVMPGWCNWKKVIISEVMFIGLIAVYVITWSDSVYNFSFVFALVYALITVCAMFFLIPLYIRKLKEQYSYTDHMNIKWFWFVLFLFCMLLGLWVYFTVSMSPTADFLFYICLSVLWATICFFIYKQQKVLDFILESNKANDEYEGRPQNQSAYNFSDELYELFDQKHLYLNPVLTLSDVARELGTNRTYLSAYLNNDLETTFFDFVNNHRLSYASMLLKEYPQMTLEQVAEKSGFNSLSTFRRSFMKKYGCTPHSYRRGK